MSDTVTPNRLTVKLGIFKIFKAQCWNVYVRCFELIWRGKVRTYLASGSSCVRSILCHSVNLGVGEVCIDPLVAILGSAGSFQNYQRIAKMEYLSFITLAVVFAGATAYLPHEKDHFFTDVVLREVVDRMSKDFADDGGAYLDFPETNRLPLGAVMPGRNVKELETEEQQLPLDYDPLGDSGNPNPSIRDQEYLQHSSLWGHQYMAGGAGEGKQRLKPEGAMKNSKEAKTDATLPAYCNPPNPCPVGYSAEDGCLEQFENTAGFSRQFQASQDCMCDSEHMFDCPASAGRDLQSSGTGNDLTDTDLDRIMEQIQVEDQHRNLVAKKFHVKKDGNPFLRGEKLPVAAKKGIDVVY